MEKKNSVNKICHAVKAGRAKLAGLTTTIALGMPMIVQAAPTSAGEGVKQILNVIAGVFPFIGAFFLVAGAFKLVMAYRNDQPEAQAGAAKDIVIGLVFILFKTLFWDAVLVNMF